MKIKYGSLKNLTAKKYDTYKTNVRDKISQLPLMEIKPFFLVTGEKLKWSGKSDKTFSLLYVGDIKLWKKDLTKQKWAKKSYAYGYCQLVQNKSIEDGKEVVSKGFVLQLQVNKGALGNPAFFKKIAKVLHKNLQKVNVQLKVVKAIEGAPKEEDTKSDAAPTAAADAKPEVTPQQLLALFNKFKKEELHTFFVKKEKNAANAKALIVKGKAIAKKMNNFIAEQPMDEAVKGALATINNKVAEAEALIAKAKDKKAKAEAKAKDKKAKAKDKKADTAIDTMANDIDVEINDLLNNFASEIEGLDDLKTVLNKVKSL